MTLHRLGTEEHRSHPVHSASFTWAMKLEEWGTKPNRWIASMASQQQPQQLRDEIHSPAHIFAELHQVVFIGSAEDHAFRNAYWSSETMSQETMVVSVIKKCLLGRIAVTGPYVTF